MPGRILAIPHIHASASRPNSKLRFEITASPETITIPEVTALHKITASSETKRQSWVNVDWGNFEFTESTWDTIFGEVDFFGADIYSIWAVIPETKRIDLVERLFKMIVLVLECEEVAKALPEEVTARSYYIGMAIPPMKHEGSRPDSLASNSMAKAGVASNEKEYDSDATIDLEPPSPRVKDYHPPAHKSTKSPKVSPTISKSSQTSTLVQEGVWNKQQNDSGVASKLKTWTPRKNRSKR